MAKVGMAERVAGRGRGCSGRSAEDVGAGTEVLEAAVEARPVGADFGAAAVDAVSPIQLQGEGRGAPIGGGGRVTAADGTGAPVVGGAPIGGGGLKNTLERSACCPAFWEKDALPLEEGNMIASALCLLSLKEENWLPSETVGDLF